MIHPSEIQGRDICFLLTVEYFGVKYRFSTQPIDIQDITSGEWHRYNGGLSDPSIEQSTKQTGVSVDGDAISVELVFAGINWVSEWLAGRVLDNSPCELSMITIKDGATTYTEQSKIYLYSGKVVQPIIGTPDKPIGHVVFSIENGLSVSNVKLLGSSFEINIYKFPGLDQRAAALGTTINYPVGKYAPFVFGIPDNFPQKDGTVGGSIAYFDKAHTSPAYTINHTGSGLTAKTDYIISMEKVQAGTARIWDKTGGNFRDIVRWGTTTDGHIYSFVRYEIGAVMEDNGFLPALDDDQTFWVSWGESSGGLPSLDGQRLTGGADICLYWLDKIGLEYDIGAWVGLSSVLNRYKFDGYVNDPEITAWNWLRENIIAYLPIEVVQGAKGITPKLNMYFQDDKVHPQYAIQESGMFQIITGLQPLEGDIVNKITVKFCYEGEFDHYLSTIAIDPTLIYEDGMTVKDIISSHSYDRYGLKEEVVELPFVWDMNTAYRIARDIIRINGLGSSGIEVRAHPQYGYIEVGDIVSLSSKTFRLENHKCQIISKSWVNNGWNFVLHLESNTLVNMTQIT